MHYCIEPCRLSRTGQIIRGAAIPQFWEALVSRYEGSMDAVDSIRHKEYQDVVNQVMAAAAYEGEATVTVRRSDGVPEYLYRSTS